MTVNNQVAEASVKYLSEAAGQAVPVGYKQTEVGIVPIDWAVCPLHNLAEKIMVGIASAATHAYRDRGVVMFRNQNIKPGFLDDSDVLYISESYEASFKNKRLKPNDLLTARTGYPGTTSLVPPQYEGAQSFTTLITRPNIGLVDPEYLCCYINSSQGQKYFEQAQIGGGQKNVNAAALKILPVCLPGNRGEQTAIANALSDVDALINELEKLIAKKQAIKTATMQQLLSGRTRLPEFRYKWKEASEELNIPHQPDSSTVGKNVGWISDSASTNLTAGQKVDALSLIHPTTTNLFALREDGTKKGYKQSELGEIPEDWEVASLGNIGQCVIGLTYSPNNVADFGTLVLRSSNVQGNRLAYEDNVYVQMDLPERVIVKNGDILICVRNGSRQLIGKCALINAKTEGSAFGAFMSVFRTQSYGFVFYQFQSDIIQNQINEIMGATINQITNKDMGCFKIPLPKLEKEQTAIATILSDMDTEIQTLQQRLSKTRQIKQGMMQELLTGRIRLL